MLVALVTQLQEKVQNLRISNQPTPTLPVRQRLLNEPLVEILMEAYTFFSVFLEQEEELISIITVKSLEPLLRS